MSPIELARFAATALFLAVAGYSAARLAWSATRTTGRATGPAHRLPDLSHALMGLAMALMVAPGGPAVPRLPGMVVFATLTAGFAARLWHEGAMSRAAAPAGPGSHGGYHLHHLAGCAAMVVMYATGHAALLTGGGASPAASGPAGALAPAELGAHAAFGGHAAATPLAAVTWLFGLYFLVAATSLGFRVGESAVRVTHRATVPAAAVGSPAPVPAAPSPASRRLLTSPAGNCASEVVLSAGMAVMFFSVL